MTTEGNRARGAARAAPHPPRQHLGHDLRVSVCNYVVGVVVAVVGWCLVQQMQGKLFLSCS